jgi:putative ABC transport system substrate-binding protein
MDGFMRRREFIRTLGGAAATAAWPLAARAQRSTEPTIGYLDGGSPSGMKEVLAAFHRGLSETGFTEGQNVAIDYRWAQGRYDQLPVLAAELVRRPVAVIAATRGPGPARAAKAVTSTIPIVFQSGSDPVRDGLVASLNRPGGNVTGTSRLSTDLIPKRLGLMSELIPKITAIALLVNPTSPQTQLCPMIS